MSLPGEVSFADFTTTTGTPFRRSLVDPNGVGDDAYVYVPAGVAEGAPVPIVWALHGYGATAGNMEGANQKKVRDAVLDRGWVVVIGDLGGNSWGNPDCMALVDNLAGWWESVWPGSPVFAFGQSMGGGIAMSALMRGSVAGLRGVACIDPAINYVWFSQNGSLASSIKSAWGATTATFPTAVTGYAPFSGTPEQYSGAMVSFYLSDSDPTAVPANNGGQMASLGLTAKMTEFRIVSSPGTHLAAASYQPDDLIAFYERVLDAPPYVPAIPPPDPEPIFRAAGGIYLKTADGLEKLAFHGA